MVEMTETMVGRAEKYLRQGHGCPLALISYYCRMPLIDGRRACPRRIKTEYGFNIGT